MQSVLPSCHLWYSSPSLFGDSWMQALDTFNTAVVSPIYYVMFTSLTILASVIMFKVTPLTSVCCKVLVSLWIDLSVLDYLFILKYDMNPMLSSNWGPSMVKSSFLRNYSLYTKIKHWIEHIELTNHLLSFLVSKVECRRLMHFSSAWGLEQVFLFFIF